jgi:hypothetical protein
LNGLFYFFYPKGTPMISHSARVLARQALTNNLNELEDDIAFDKAAVSNYYDRCDILLANETSDEFKKLNFWKTELRNDRSKAARIRKALKELK